MNPGSGVEESEGELWGRWREGRDPAARNALILFHASWARSVARDIYLRLRPRDIDWGEFAQNATVGLIEAADRFDPTRGIEFRAFARHRVRGAVFNGLRQLWDKLPRPTRVSDADRVRSLDEEENNPFESFVSLTIGLGIGHLLDVASLPYFETQRQDPYALLQQDQMHELLQRTMEFLPERERIVLTLHYFQHVPFIEIAELLSLTKGRISQLHRQGIERLRGYLREYTAQCVL